MKKGLLTILIVCTAAWCSCSGQLWSGILSPTYGSGACTTAPSDQAAECAIDWADYSGIPGGIPSGWTQSGSTISAPSGDATATIQAALNACGTNQFVQLAAGTFTLASSLTVPSNCYLNGMGANQTLINATGTGTMTTCEPSGGDGDTQAICLGNGGVSYSPTQVSVTSGATAGSTSLTLSSTSGMAAGGYLVLTDTNDSWVTISGGEGSCTWCDGWTSDGSRSRGQIEEIESVSGSTVTVSPPLYTDYANSPEVTYFAAAAKYAGVSNLAIKGSGKGESGWGALVGMNECAYCWVNGVAFQYSDNNWLNLAWSYRDQVQNSYFSNSLDHGPGSFDGTLDIFFKTTGAVVQNNIFERGHVSGVMFEWGAAGDVVAYNYFMAGFDTSATDWPVESIDYHGAHPQFMLQEGNAGVIYQPDEIWGSDSHNTNHRNWWRGTSMMCNPVTGAAGTVTCTPSGFYGASGVNGWLDFAYSYAENISHLTWYDNFVNDVVGSANQQAVPAFGGSPESNVAILSWTSAGCSSGCRDVNGPGVTAYNFTFGFGELSDDGSGSGCGGGTAPCHSVDAWETSYLYNTYTFTNTATNCTVGGVASTSCTTADPPSFYLSSKPSWWTSTIPWPAIGSDVTGGTGPGGHASLTASNPAQNCYLNVMGGVEGGAGGPLSFNASTCYSSITPAPPTDLTGTVTQQ